MTEYYRNKIIREKVELPSGMKICTNCRGRGMTSRYDEGWRSYVHSDELAALRTCFLCAGKGCVPTRENPI